MKGLTGPLTRAPRRNHANKVTPVHRDRFTGTPGSTGPGQKPDASAGTTDSASPDAGEPQDTRLEVYGDSSYGSGEARAAYRDAGHDTVIKKPASATATA